MRVANAQVIGVHAGTTPTAMVLPGAKLAVPVIVDLSAAAPLNVASLITGMTWGPARLTLDSLRLSLSGWTLTPGTTDATAGLTRFRIFRSTSLPGTATLATAYFTASSTTGGTQVRLSPMHVANQAQASVLSAAVPRHLDVCIANAGKGGDASGDGVVNIVDAQQVARYAVGLSVGNAVAVVSHGDVNGDGTINIVDAQQIARYAVGLSVSAAVAERINVESWAAPVITSLVTSPSTQQTMVPGDLLQINAAPRSSGNVDQTGCSAVTWASSNTSVATVSASGIVTAVGTGSATITATSATNPAATATVGISVPAPAVLFDEFFVNSSLSGRGWYDNTAPVLTSSEYVSGPSANGTLSAQFAFNSGATSAVQGAAMRKLFTAGNSVFMSYQVKYSTNWVGSNRAYHPHEFHVLSSMDGNFDGPSNNWLGIYVEQNYQNGGRPRIAMQDNKAINTAMGTPSTNLNLTLLTESRSVSGCNGQLESGMTIECFTLAPWYNLKQLLGPVTFSPTAGAGYKNNWNQVEAYFKMNTVVNGFAQANGIMQYWFNGTLILERRDVTFRTAARPTLQFRQFVIAPYIGDGSPVAQTMWVDNIRVATGRVPPP
jgi:hypothetical protein